MATVQSEPAAGLVEAVIISGPRKGDIVRLENGDVVLSPEEERAFDEVQAAAERCVQAAKELAAEVRGMSEDVRAIRRVLQHGNV